ncbi:MAG: hypothetical protein ACK5BY_13515 [Limnohabitans sp.]
MSRSSTFLPAMTRRARCIAQDASTSFQGMRLASTARRWRESII